VSLIPVDQPRQRAREYGRPDMSDTTQINGMVADGFGPVADAFGWLFSLELIGPPMVSVGQAPSRANPAALAAGWGRLHAVGLTEIVDVPIAGGDLPAVLALAVGPNPAREAASVRFDLPTAGSVTLAVYDVAGRAVRTLADGESLEPGRHGRVWNGLSNAGGRVPAGVYFVRMVTPGGALTKTLVRVD